VLFDLTGHLYRPGRFRRLSNLLWLRFFILAPEQGAGRA
jgi:hypothetical protein